MVCDWQVFYSCMNLGWWGGFPGAIQEFWQPLVDWKGEKLSRDVANDEEVFSVRGGRHSGWPSPGTNVDLSDAALLSDCYMVPV